jgi:hypothetical protein
MKKMYGLFLLATTLFAACNDSSTNLEVAKSAPLSVSVNISDKVSTRAGLVTNFSAENVAVFVAGDGYAPSDISTVLVTTASGSSTSVGSPTPAINIAATAHVYGFYPSTTVSNPTAISTIPATVNATEASFNAAAQTDYMYATQNADVTKASPTVTLTFHHALTKLTFIVNKGTSYAGVGALAQVKLTSNPEKGFLSGTGTMDIASGAFNGMTTTTDLILNGTATINAVAGTETTASALVVPVTALPTAITLGMTIDTQPYSGTLTQTTGVTAWEPGKNYTYTVTVAGGVLSITSVSITNWTSVPGGTSDVH